MGMVKRLGAPSSRLERILRTPWYHALKRLDWAAGWILPLGAMTLLPLKKDLQVLRKLGQDLHWRADNRSSVLQKYQHRHWSTQPCLMESDRCRRRFNCSQHN